MGRRSWIQDTGRQPVFYVRRPSAEHSQLCGLQELPSTAREQMSPGRIITEWEDYIGELRRERFTVEELPSLVRHTLGDEQFGFTAEDGPEEANRGVADQEFVRDGMLITPQRRCIIGNFAPQSRHRNRECVGFRDHFAAGLFSTVGFDKLPEATLILSGDKQVEFGDVEMFYVQGRGWTAVIGKSARTNDDGIKELVGFFKVEGIKSVVIEVGAQVGKKRQPSMHWTTRGHPVGPDTVGLKFKYFDEKARRKLQKAGLRVLEMPDPDDGSEQWSSNFKIAPDLKRGGGYSLAFSHAGHPETNAWLEKVGVRVVPIQIGGAMYFKEGGADCMIQDVAA